jgi:hypothetical protein
VAEKKVWKLYSKGIAMTEVRTRSKPVAPALSIAPRGHWKNKFHSERDAVFGNGDVNPAGEWFAVMEWPSRDVAETRAAQHMAEFAEWTAFFGITYLGAVFFPEDGKKP